MEVIEAHWVAVQEGSPARLLLGLAVRVGLCSNRISGQWLHSRPF
jgi:hypothetical protein